MLYYNSRALLRYNNSSKIPCTKPWFFPLKLPKISFLMKVLKIGIFGRFLTEWKMHYLAIFLLNSIVTGMPYLPAKDELVSLNRLSSRGLWKWYNSKVLDRRLYGVGQQFTFCRFSRKRKFFGNFDCDFRKCFTKGFFLTEYEDFEISVLTENSRYLQTAALKENKIKWKLIFEVLLVYLIYFKRAELG